MHNCYRKIPRFDVSVAAAAAVAVALFMSSQKSCNWNLFQLLVLFIFIFHNQNNRFFFVLYYYSWHKLWTMTVPAMERMLNSCWLNVARTEKMVKKGRKRQRMRENGIESMMGKREKNGIAKEEWKRRTNERKKFSLEALIKHPGSVTIIITIKNCKFSSAISK